MGTLTTTNWAGTTVNGRTAYLVTGISGSRTYINNGLNISGAAVNLLQVGSPNTQQLVSGGASFFDYLAQAGLSSDISNSIFYASYPYFDQYGLNVIASGAIGNEDASNLTVSTFRLWIDQGSYSFNEWVSDPNYAPGYYYWFFTYSASAIFQPSAGTSLTALAQQCLPTAGPVQNFQFCYYVDAMAQPTNPYFLYVYGTFTATGPVPRNGRNAYTLQTMNGVRSLTANGVTNSSGIIFLEWIQSDLNLGYINDNLVYTTQPYIDSQGHHLCDQSRPRVS